MKISRGLVAADDEPLAELLRALPDIRSVPPSELRHVLQRAELHGLGGVVHELITRAGIELEEDVAGDVALRAMARDLDHAAHLALLDTIDRALAEHAIPAASLKGPLFAERFYTPKPSVRATSDVDVLVAEGDLERAVEALRSVGYVPHAGPEEERFRREHHHLHLDHPRALSLELHFHAYRGFGRVIPGEPLVSRRRILNERRYRSLGVLSPPDELVYLAVHAAAHRFVRLGWLWDIKLLLEHMQPEQLELAAERARDWGYSRVTSFTAELLVDVLGVRSSSVAALGSVDRVRAGFARQIVRAPAWSPARSATRFVYTSLLCDSPGAATRYASSAVFSRVRDAVRPGAGSAP